MPIEYELISCLPAEGKALQLFQQPKEKKGKKIVICPGSIEAVIIEKGTGQILFFWAIFPNIGWIGAPPNEFQIQSKDWLKLTNGINNWIKL